MNKSEIIEGDKLIAEFMREKATGGYHQSWDWLMPVVEKIWNMQGHRTSIFYFEPEEGVTIYGNNESVNNITDCWCAVVEFIKWYNTQNQ